MKNYIGNGEPEIVLIRLQLLIDLQSKAPGTPLKRSFAVLLSVASTWADSIELKGENRMSTRRTAYLDRLWVQPVFLRVSLV